MMARTCEACAQLIPGRYCLELAARVLKTVESDSQDSVEEARGDYCEGCIRSGAALKDLFSGVTKYKWSEAPKPESTEP